MSEEVSGHDVGHHLDLSRLLDLLADCDMYGDQLYWTGRGEGRHFFFTVNDVFWWATSDTEPISSDEDLELLHRCIVDLGELGEPLYAPELYAARRRGMRPQRPWLDRFTGGSVRALFEAAGPTRDE